MVDERTGKLSIANGFQVFVQIVHGDLEPNCVDRLEYGSTTRVRIFDKKIVAYIDQ